jgi:Proteins of 100 residues with WXG
VSLLDTIAGDVIAVLGHLRAALGQIVRFGGVESLAGHPGELRRAAQAWRECASDLRALEQDLSGDAHRATGYWQDNAVSAFQGQWDAAGGKIDALASDLDWGAQSLDRAAAQIEREIALLRTVVADIESLIAILSGGGDPVALAAAVQHAPGLIDQMQAVLDGIDSLLASVSGWLRSMGLTFVHVLGQIPAVVPEMASQVWGAARSSPLMALAPGALEFEGELGVNPSPLAAFAAGALEFGGELELGGLGLDGTILGAPAGVVVNVVGGVVLTAGVVAGAIYLFGQKQTPPTLSAQEQAAVAAHDSGQPNYDRKAYKSAQQKITQGAKYNNKRNVGKHRGQPNK